MSSISGNNINVRDPRERGGSLSQSLMLGPNGEVPHTQAKLGITKQDIEDEKQRRQSQEAAAKKVAVAVSSIPSSVNVLPQPTLQASIHSPTPKREPPTASILHGQQHQSNPTQISSGRYTPHAVSGHVTNVRSVNPSAAPTQELSTDDKIKVLTAQVELLTQKFAFALNEIALLRREIVESRNLFTSHEVQQIRSFLNNNTSSDYHYSGYGSPHYDPNAVSSLTTSRLPVPSSSQPTTPTPYYYSDSSSTSTGHQSN